MLEDDMAAYDQDGSKDKNAKVWYYMTMETVRIISECKRRIFEHMIDLEYRIHREQRNGNVLDVATREEQHVEGTRVAASEQVFSPPPSKRQAVSSRYSFFMHSSALMDRARDAQDVPQSSRKLIHALDEARMLLKRRQQQQQQQQQ